MKNLLTVSTELFKLISYLYKGERNGIFKEWYKNQRDSKNRITQQAQQKFGASLFSQAGDGVKRPDHYLLSTIFFEKNSRTNLLVPLTVTAQIVRVEDEALTKI